MNRFPYPCPMFVDQKSGSIISCNGDIASHNYYRSPLCIEQGVYLVKMNFPHEKEKVSLHFLFC